MKDVNHSAQTLIRCFTDIEEMMTEDWTLVRSKDIDCAQW